MSEDDSPPDDFDYGDRLPDGQFERHPTIDEGEFVQPVRDLYVHDECGVETRMPEHLAKSVARDPDHYGKTFCAHCGEYVPTDEVRWAVDDAPWNFSDG